MRLESLRASEARRPYTDYRSGESVRPNCELPDGQIVSPLGPRVTRLARGLPVGGDLEYADDLTLARAFEGRSDF